MSFRIQNIWAFISVDEEGEDGVCAFYTSEGWMPLIAADDKRLQDLKPQALIVAAASGKAVRMVKFSVREDVEITDGKEWRPAPHE